VVLCRLLTLAGNANRSHESLALCPKVYHQDCLGFEVPEDTEWLCPRHYCMKCGLKHPKFMCRFCPMSFCQVTLLSIAVAAALPLSLISPRERTVALFRD
jgi:hypothetical protein